MKKDQKLYHVELLEHSTLGVNKKHHYFGSISAIFETFTDEQLGIKLTSLWSNHDFDNEPYENKVCIIRKGDIKRKTSNRGKK